MHVHVAGSKGIFVVHYVVLQLPSSVEDDVNVGRDMDGTSGWCHITTPLNTPDPCQRYIEVGKGTSSTIIS